MALRHHQSAGEKFHLVTDTYSIVKDLAEGGDAGFTVEQVATLASAPSRFSSLHVLRAGLRAPAAPRRDVSVPSREESGSNPGSTPAAGGRVSLQERQRHCRRRLKTEQ